MLRVWAIAGAVLAGAGSAFAAVAVGELKASAASEQPRANSRSDTQPVTTTTPPPPPPVLPFNAKIRSDNIPVPGGGFRSGGCSGSLIAPEWIITAGHCFHDGNHVRKSGPPRSTVMVTLGKTKDSDAGGQTAQVIDVRQSPMNDIALARLNVAVTGIEPLVLTSGPPAVGQQLQFAGWGALSPTDPAPSDHLKRGQFAVQSIESVHLEAESVVPRTVENSPCPQDSGAPYFISTDDRTGVLVAVESSGPPCPQAGLEIISRVDVVVDWIHEQTGNTTRSN